MSALGALDKSCDSLLAMLIGLNTPYNLRNCLILNMNISIRCTYYIFCQQKKEWTCFEGPLNYFFASLNIVFPFSFVFFLHSNCHECEVETANCIVPVIRELYFSISNMQLMNGLKK